MPRIEGFRIQNFRGLKDITLGKLYTNSQTSLTPLTAVIGKNGSGKSSIFDAFGFLADCLSTDIGTACEMRQRGGFKRLRSQSVNDPIKFEILYKESKKSNPIIYNVHLSIDDNDKPVVLSETLSLNMIYVEEFKKLNANYANHYDEFNFDDKILMTRNKNQGILIKNSLDESSLKPLGFIDDSTLAISTLGELRNNIIISDFRDFIKGWYLSYFHPDSARKVPLSGFDNLLDMHGENLANVVQFMQSKHGDRFQEILGRISQKIPGIINIQAQTTIDNRVVLSFNDGAFTDPFLASQMSDGTLKLFAYLLLLELPDPPPFICIEEPENGLYPKLLEGLAREFRTHANRAEKPSQMFITTHQPYFVDALSPEEVWILERGNDGFAKIRRASDDPIIRSLTAEGLPLGSLWYSNYLD